MQVRIASDCGILIQLQLGKGSDRPKATWSRGESSLPVCAWAAPGLIITSSRHVFVTLSIPMWPPSIILQSILVYYLPSTLQVKITHYFLSLSASPSRFFPSVYSVNKYLLSMPCGPGTILGVGCIKVSKPEKVSAFIELTLWWRWGKNINKCVCERMEKNETGKGRGYHRDAGRSVGQGGQSGKLLQRGDIEQRESKNKEHHIRFTHWYPQVLAQCLAQERGSLNICEMKK